MYDMKNLEQFKMLEVHAPEAMKAFMVFDRQPGAMEPFQRSIRN